MTAVHRPLLPTRGCTRDPPSSPCATRGSCSWVWAPARGRGRSWPRPGAPPGSAPPGWLVERETREREFLTGKRKCFRLERDYSRLLPDPPRHLWLAALALAAVWERGEGGGRPPGVHPPEEPGGGDGEVGRPGCALPPGPGRGRRQAGEETREARHPGGREEEGRSFILAEC